MAIKGLKSYYKENWTPYHALTEDQVEKVILGAFEILETIGIKTTRNPKMRELYKKHGAIVEGEIVKVPRELVVKAIHLAPTSVKLYNRNGDKCLDITGTNSFVGSAPCNPFFNDFETNECKRTLLKDCANAAKLVEALDEFDFAMSMSDPADYPAELKDLYCLRAMLENTDKPIGSIVTNIDTLKESTEMLKALYGSLEAFIEKPSVFMVTGEADTPLCTFPEENTEKHFFCAEKKMPQTILSFIQLGTVTPVTLANSIMLGIAEIFFLMTITQLEYPGAPEFYGLISGTVDMSNTRTCYSTPEHVLCEAAAADVFHYLNLPTYGTGGAVSSKVVDEQCAIELAMTLGMAIIDGGCMIHNVGFMEDGMTSHYDILTLVDDIAGYARRIKRGIRFDEDTEDLEVIREVGPGGQFLTCDETVLNFRKETWYPKLHDRNRMEFWVKNGRKDLRTRIHEKTKQILETPVPNKVPADVEAKFDEILKKANKRIAR